jgi:hypothetical protein
VDTNQASASNSQVKQIHFKIKPAKKSKNASKNAKFDADFKFVGKVLQKCKQKKLLAKT